MSKLTFWFLVGLFTFWGEAALSQYFLIADLKINFVLMIYILLVLRWKSPVLWVFALLFGLMMDTMTHSMLGVNGISFFVTILAAHWAGEWLYDDNFFSTMVFVCVLSFLEGGITLLLLKILENNISWNHLFFTIVAPLSLIQGVIAPFLLSLLKGAERMFSLNPESPTSSTPY